MKSRTLIPNLQQPQQVSQSAINSSLTYEVNVQTSRSRLMDSFNFMMGLIEAEPFPFIKNSNAIPAAENLMNLDQWQSSYFQDDFAVGEC